MNYLLSGLAALVCLSPFAMAEGNDLNTVCGKDDRVPSQVRPIARMMQKVNDNDGGCTGTLISGSCMISAGHCKDFLKVAEFDVPASTAMGSVKHPDASLQYELDRIIAYRYEGVGKDWAVYKIKPHAVTKKTAGSVRGFYKVNLSTAPFFKPTVIRITGYGMSTIQERNFVQQTSKGKITHTGPGNISYKVDSTGGNSGSALILEGTQEIIGIHTNGGCYASDTGSNEGTLFAGNPDLIQAIKQCVSSSDL